LKALAKICAFYVTLFISCFE